MGKKYLKYIWYYYYLYIYNNDFINFDYIHIKFNYQKMLN